MAFFCATISWPRCATGKLRGRLHSRPCKSRWTTRIALGWDAQVVRILQRILNRHADTFVKAHAMGVQIVAGSDAGSCGVAHGLGLLEELEFMERAGAVARCDRSRGNRSKLPSGLPSKKSSAKSNPATGAASFSRAIRRLKPSPTFAREKIVVFDDQVFATGDSPDAQRALKARYAGRSKFDKHCAVFHREPDARGRCRLTQRCVQHHHGIGAYVETPHQAFALLCAG